MQVSNTASGVDATNGTRELALSDEEKRRLVQYFSVLIEIDQKAKIASS